MLTYTNMKSARKKVKWWDEISNWWTDDIWAEPWMSRSWSVKIQGKTLWAEGMADSGSQRWGPSWRSRWRKSQGSWGLLNFWECAAAAAAAKSLQLCPTLWDPRDGSPPGSPVPGILQARTLEWVPISFSNNQPRKHIKKQRHYFANKGSPSQGYGFSSGHVWMWELDYKDSWAPKNGCFWTVVLEKTFESPLDCKEIKWVNPKGNQL